MRKFIIAVLLLLLAMPFLAAQKATVQAGSTACIQVITYAVNENGYCKEFPTPCNVPNGWKIVDSCKDYNGLKTINQIKEQIKERVNERLQEVKENLATVRERVMNRLDQNLIGKPFSTVNELQVGEEMEIAEGIILKLLSVESNCNIADDANNAAAVLNCPAVMSSAAFSIISTEGNLSEEFVLEGNQRKVVAGLSIKLLATTEDSARFQILPIKELLPPAMGKGNITITPNIKNIAKGIDELIEDSNILDDLNSLSKAEINSLVIGPMRKEIMAEIRTEAGKILKSVPLIAMQRIKANIRSKNGFADLNIVQRDENWFIQTPSGTEIPLKWDVKVDENNLYIMTPKLKRLVVLPEQASDIAKERANMYKVNSVQIAEQDGMPVYTIKGRQRGKLLGIFDTEFDIDATTDIESGDIIATRKPWWSFLVFGK